MGNTRCESTDFKSDLKHRQGQDAPNPVEIELLAFFPCPTKAAGNQQAEAPVNMHGVASVACAPPAGFARGIDLQAPLTLTLPCKVDRKQCDHENP